MGGSQGAHAINLAVMDALPRIRQRTTLRMVHQTGAADLNEVTAAYLNAGIDAEVKAFFQDMASRYGRADLVVCRAGATTVAELTALGKPALLIPYPFAADNHQELNARAMVDRGAAQMVLERNLTGADLALAHRPVDGQSGPAGRHGVTVPGAGQTRCGPGDRGRLLSTGGKRTMYLKKYHIHFVGIGGIGMSGIAELLLNLGYRVSGSDLKASDITANLQRLGGSIHIGHRAEQIAGADVVVVSSAIDTKNPEVAAARQAAVPVIPRAEMLAELMRLKYSVAIAGAHGKTSTTSLVANVLAGGGLDPTVVIGGKLKSLGRNAVLGQGDFIVAEADESDGSFLKFSPAIAVVTNIDREHLDFYEDLEAIKTVFLNFIDRIPFYGLAVLCLDNEPLQGLLPRIKKRLTTYGRSTQADYQARDISFGQMRSRFTVVHRGENLGEFQLAMPGMHNVYNALAAIAVGLELDIELAAIKQALATAEGVQRRMEIKGEFNGITVVDDYGHHPTEIQVTLEAVKSNWPDRRKVVVFQPHRYTRTRALLDDFTRSFNNSDVLVVLPIYAASEAPIAGVSGQALGDCIRAHGHRNVVCLDSLEACVDHLDNTLAPGDVLLTLGAGDVYRVGEMVLDRMSDD